MAQGGRSQGNGSASATLRCNGHQPFEPHGPLVIRGPPVGGRCSSELPSVRWGPAPGRGPVQAYCRKGRATSSGDSSDPCWRPLHSRQGQREPGGRVLAGRRREYRLSRLRRRGRASSAQQHRDPQHGPRPGETLTHVTSPSSPTLQGPPAIPTLHTGSPAPESCLPLAPTCGPPHPGLCAALGAGSVWPRAGARSPSQARFSICKHSENVPSQPAHACPPWSGHR